MKCQPVIKIIPGLFLMLTAVIPSIAFSNPIMRTQIGVYDLAEKTKHIYNLEMLPTPTGINTVLTHPDNSHFIIASHLAPCFAPQTNSFNEGYIEVTRSNVVDIDDNLLPLINFTHDSNMLFSSKMLSDTRQLLFLEDSTTVLMLDTSTFKMNSTGCPQH